MPKAALFDQAGTRQGDVDLPEGVFGTPLNVPLVHEALTAQLASRRSGTHSTRTRGEVRGGGRKPWRQKGTGRARVGSRRSPLWIGGGITFGPKPRSYAQRLPKQVRRHAVRSILSDKAQNGNLIVLGDFRLETPKTREMAQLLDRLGLAGRKVLFVTAESLPPVARAGANLPGVKVLTARTLNVHDLLAHSDVVMARDALTVVEQAWGGARDGGR